MKEADCIRKNYFFLFNRITDALAELEAQNIGMAREILMQAQREAEDRFLNAEA